MPEAGLDAEKLDVLRSWGRGLRRDERQEVAAAGRAILLLIEEIERLHVVLWGRQLYPLAEAPPDAPGGALEDGPAAPEDELATPLRGRLRRFVGRPPAAAESTGKAPDG